MPTAGRRTIIGAVGVLAFIAAFFYCYFVCNSVFIDRMGRDIAAFEGLPAEGRDHPTTGQVISFLHSEKRHTATLVGNVFSILLGLLWVLTSCVWLLTREASPDRLARQRSG